VRLYRLFLKIVILTIYLRWNEIITRYSSHDRFFSSISIVYPLRGEGKLTRQEWFLSSLQQNRHLRKLFSHITYNKIVPIFVERTTRKNDDYIDRVGRTVALMLRSRDRSIGKPFRVNLVMIACITLSLSWLKNKTRPQSRGLIVSCVLLRWFPRDTCVSISDELKKEKKKQTNWNSTRDNMI